MSPDRILVTGGTGNVGSDIVRQLLEDVTGRPAFTYAQWAAHRAAAFRPAAA